MEDVLNVVILLQRKYNKRLARLKELKTSRSVANVTVRDGLPQGTWIKSKVEELAIRISELEESVKTLREILQACRSELKKLLAAKLRDKEMLFYVFLFRYVYCNSFRSIAQKLRLPVSTVFYWHKKGLKRFNIFDSEVDLNAEML